MQNDHILQNVKPKDTKQLKNNLRTFLSFFEDCEVEIINLMDGTLIRLQRTPEFENFITQYALNPVSIISSPRSQQDREKSKQFMDNLTVTVTPTPTHNDRPNDSNDHDHVSSYRTSFTQASANSAASDAPLNPPNQFNHCSDEIITELSNTELGVSQTSSTIHKITCVVKKSTNILVGKKFFEGFF